MPEHGAQQQGARERDRLDAGGECSHEYQKNECKLGDEPIAPGLRYLTARFPGVVAWQVSAFGQRDYVSPEGVRVAPAVRLLKDLV